MKAMRFFGRWYRMTKNQNNPFENLPPCASDYIKLIIKKMRWRKKVREDVQAELIAHFEDALRDCKTNDEKEKAAEELIANFGDADLIATLARRAKKRCRPMWQKAIIRLWQFLFVLFCFFNLYILWFFTGTPKITIDYLSQLNNYAKPAFSNDTQNAYTYYDQAAKKAEKIPKDLQRLFHKQYFECNEPEKKIGAEWIAANQDILQLISTGTTKPYCRASYKSDGNDMLSVQIPIDEKYYTFFLILKWDACILAEQGKYSEAFENILTTYKLGKHIKTRPTTIEQIIGMVLKSGAAQNFRLITSRYDVGKEQLVKFQNEFQPIIQNDDFSINFETEKWMIYDEVQRCFTDDAFGGHIIFRQFEKMLPKIQQQNDQKKEFWNDLFYIVFLHPDKKETLHDVEEVYDCYANLANQMPANRQNTKPFKSKLNNNLFIKMFYPPDDRTLNLSFMYKVDVDATVTIISILRFKYDNNNYPETLQQLKETGYISEIPIDPFSGKEITYKLTKDGFKIYSFGSDFDDDGGKMNVTKNGKPYLWDAKDGDAVFWPVVKTTAK
jgi:hypothetical protein